MDKYLEAKVPDQEDNYETLFDLLGIEHNNNDQTEAGAEEAEEEVEDKVNIKLLEELISQLLQNGIAFESEEGR